MAAFLKCAIPAMSQWILGKIELDGHALYEECSKWRCVWHGDNDVEEVLGRAMAQAILPKDQYSQFTLAIDAESGGEGSLVQKFLKGQTKAANSGEWSAARSHVCKERPERGFGARQGQVHRLQEGGSP